MKCTPDPSGTVCLLELISETVRERKGKPVLPVLPSINIYTHFSGLFRRALKGSPGDLVVKNLPAKSEEVGSIPGSEKSPGEGNDNPLQYSCLGNPMDRGAYRLQSLRL